jgi:hypothetical protein
MFCFNNAGQGQGSGGGGVAGAGGGGGGGSGIGAVVPGTQDSVQIVAQAALCFDNKPVTISHIFMTKCFKETKQCMLL